MKQETAKYVKKLLEDFQRAEKIFDNIAMLKEDGGTLTLDFNGKSTGRLFVIGPETEGAILTAIQNGLQELMFDYQKRVEEL